MSIPTIESLSAAARAGVTAIQPDGGTVRIRGAAAVVGDSVIGAGMTRSAIRFRGWLTE